MFGKALIGCGGGADVVIPQVDLSQNLIGHFLLNNNGHNLVSGANIAGIGTPQFDGNAMVGVSGTAASVETGVSNANYASISFWTFLKGDNTTGSAFGNRNFTDRFSYYTYSSTNKPYIYIEWRVGTTSGSTNYQIHSVTTIDIPNDGAWVHFYVERRNGEEWDTVWINGIPSNSKSHPSYTTGFFDKTFLDTIEIGPRTENVANTYYNGLTSNVRLYSTNKDQAFIDALYTEGYYPKPLPLPTTDGLVAHYPLTGTAESTTGNYHGTEVGNTYVDDIEFGSVGNFSAVGNYIGITGGLLMTGNWTYSTWIYRLSGGGSLTKEITGGGTGISIRAPQISSTKYGFTIAGVADYKFTSGPDVPLNVWVHVCYRKISSTQVELWIDGIYKTVITASNPTLMIARFSNNDSASWFYGYMRNCRGYNRSLTGQEITDIYNYEKNFRPIHTDDGLVAYYPLKTNSLDNYNNQYDTTNTSVTFDGQSADFSVTDARLLKTSIGVSFGAISNWTMAVWIKVPVAHPTTEAGIVVITREGLLHGLIRITLNNNSIYCGFLNSTPAWSAQIPSTVTVNDDTWKHIAYTYDGITQKIYVNGVFNNQLATTGVTYNFSPFGILLGDLGGTGDYDYAGKMSKVRIYKKTITPEQVAVIYNTERIDFE